MTDVLKTIAIVLVIPFLAAYGVLLAFNLAQAVGEARNRWAMHRDHPTYRPRPQRRGNPLGARPKDSPKVPPAGIRVVDRTQAERREAYTLRSAAQMPESIPGYVVVGPTPMGQRPAPDVKLDYVVQAPTPFPWPREPKEN